MLLYLAHVLHVQLGREKATFEWYCVLKFQKKFPTSHFHSTLLHTRVKFSSLWYTCKVCFGSYFPLRTYFTVFHILHFVCFIMHNKG